MRVMFASTRGAGHLGPILPLAEACKRAGHQVLIAGPPSLSACVARSGHAFWPLDDPPPAELDAVWATVPGLPRHEQNRVVIGEINARLTATATLPRHRAACRDFRPDVIVRESSEFGSALAAELHGIPHARIATGLAATEALAIAIAAPALDSVRRAAGLPSDPTGETLRDAPCFTWFPSSLEEPSIPVPTNTVRLRDPAWDAWPIRLPSVWWTDSTDPLVYVSFGSIAGADPQAIPLFSMAMQALSTLPIRVLLTVGPELDLTALPPTPANVHIERWVPQDQVLPHAGAVVCHAGSGTTLGALATGRPLVLMPLFSDQPDNARRVEAAGAGLTVGPDVASLRAAVESVLADRPYTAAAGRLASELRGHLLPSAAIDVLASLAAGSLAQAA